MKRFSATPFTLLALALLAAGATAQDSGKYEKRVYTTQHAGPQPPRIDGDLSDPCWDRVEWADDFVQWEPAEGEPPSQRTAFKILYDESALYIGYRAYDDEPDKIENMLARRDWFPGDWVEINIDSYHDHRTAFSFTASVSGTRGDEFISDDGNNWDSSWDPIWESRTKIDDEGWTAEVKIPLSQLRYAQRDEHVWGIQVQRRLFREEERSVWQPKSKDEQGWVSRFGELRGIRGIRAQRQVELLPYTVTRAETFQKVPGDPFNDGSRADLSFGIDGKIGVTSDLMLDLTVNPDFGQVEADPSEVNLTAFETFFSEKRPFFIEGNNILDFQIAPAITGGGFTRDNLFYSRRIGRAPSHYPSLDDGEYAEVPDNSSILGAVKLSGKTRDGLSIGILESMTAKERATIDLQGDERKETVEPFTNFFVGRVQKDFDRGNTRVGGMLTAVNRDIEDDHLDFLHTSAYAGGIDFLHYFADRSWRVALNGVASRVQGSEEAILGTQRSSARYFQRPDNDYEDVDSTRTSLSGHGGSFRIAKVGGESPFRFETGAAWRSPGFEINDIGFLRRSDEINQFTWVQYSVREPFSIFRRLSINGNQWIDWDFGGNHLIDQANVNFNTDFRNNWSCGAELTRAWEHVSNNALRGGPSSKWPGSWDTGFWINSDHRKALQVEFGGSFGRVDDGDSGYKNWWSWLAFRPSNALRVSVSPSYTISEDELQYVSNASFGGDDRYLFGRIDQETLSATFRIDYTVTPNLTVQYYGSPFVSAGRYGEFKRITDPQAEAYAGRFHVFDGGEISYLEADGTYEVDEDGDGSTDYSFGDPDFNFRDFNSNLVVRWEFSPGSTLFLVWSQARSDFVNDGRFSYGNDLEDLFGAHPHNTFLLKVNKWLSL